MHLVAKAVLNEFVKRSEHEISVLKISLQVGY